MQVYVRAELCTPLGGTIFLLVFLFCFQLFNWAALSIWYKLSLFLSLPAKDSDRVLLFIY